MQRAVALSLDTTEHKRTEYAIRLTLPGSDRPQYAERGNRWTDDPTRAIRCATMTEATILAIEVLRLGPDAFTVEAV